MLKRMYVVKELTVLYDNGSMDHYLFAPPTTLRLTAAEATTVRYASKYLNGLSFNDGCIPFEDIYTIIRKLAGRHLS